jgi:hypothetical protein
MRGDFMAYSDFTLEKVLSDFALVPKKSQLFDRIEPIAMSDWLTETLNTTVELALQSGTEKARSELIISPILLEIQRRNQKDFTFYSGKTLDVDKAKGLSGECDFILSKGEANYTIQAPIIALVEAKKQDMESGLGQCAAQVVAAQIFNQKHDNSVQAIFGCVTTGQDWWFLRLVEKTLAIDKTIYYLNEVEKILGIFQTILDLFGEEDSNYGLQ